MKSSAVLMILVVAELVLAFFFIRGILMGRGNNLLLGTILGVQFLVLALAMISYLLISLPPRTITEDRDEGLLW